MSSETSAAPTEVSADATAGWLVQTADEGFKFHFDRDPGAAASVKLARFEQASVYAAVDGNDEALVAPAGVSPLELWHETTAMQAEEHFAFHQGPIHAGATAVGEPVVLFSATVANAVAASQLGQFLVSPGNGVGPHQSGHEPHTQGGSNNPHTETNTVASSELVELEVTPGGGANHNQSGHEPHTPSQQGGSNNPHSVANAAAVSELAQLEVSPGGGSSHNQPHEPNANSHQANSNNPHSAANAAAVSELAQLEVSPGGGPSHQPAAASVSHPPTANGPNHGNSFHFNNEVPTSNPTESITLTELGFDVPNAHGNGGGNGGGHGGGHGGPAAVLEITAATLAPAEEHASHANFHALGHGPHELLV